MKKLITLIFTLGAFSCYAQFGISYHQSNLPFAGFNYEIADRWRPELPIGTDAFIDGVSLEAVVTYDILDRKSMNFTADWE